MSDASIGTLKATVEADVSQYLASMKLASEQAGATVEALQEIAEASQAMVEAMDEAGSSAESFGQSSSVSMSASIDVAKQLGGALESMGKFAVESALAMDPKANAEWQKSVTEAENAAKTLAGSLGKQLIPILESVMAEGVKLAHFIGSISFKKMGDDATFVAKEIWDELSQLGKKLEGWAGQLGEMLRKPFNTMLDAVLASIEGALDMMGSIADFAKDKLGLGEGGGIFRGAAKSVDAYGGRDHAADIATGLNEAAHAVGAAVSEAVGVAVKAYVGPSAGPDHDFSKPVVDKAADAQYEKIAALQQALSEQSNKARLDAEKAAGQLELQNAHEAAQTAQQGFEQVKGTLEVAYRSGSNVQIAAAQQAADIALKGVNEAQAQIVAITQNASAEAMKRAVDLEAAAKKADGDIAQARAAWQASDTETNRQNMLDLLDAAKQAHAEANAAASDASKTQIEAAKAAGDEARQAAKDAGDLQKSAADEAARMQKNARAIEEHQMAQDAARDNAIGNMALGAAQKVPVLGGVISGAMQGAQAGPEAAIVMGALAALEQSKKVGEVMAEVGGDFQMVVDALGSMVGPLLDIPGPLKVLLPLLEGASQMLHPITDALGRMWSGLFDTAPLMQQIGVILAGHFGKEIRHIGDQLGLVSVEMSAALLPMLELFLKGVEAAATAMGPAVITGLETLAEAFHKGADVILWTAAQFDYMGNAIAQRLSQIAGFFGQDDLAKQLNEFGNALYSAAYDTNVARNNLDNAWSNPPNTTPGTDPLKDNTDATHKNTQAMADMQASLSNAPSGFKAALAEFNSINTNPLSDPTNDHYDPRNDPSSPDYIPDQHSGNTTRSLHHSGGLGGGSGGEVVTIQQLIVYAQNPDDMLRQVQEKIRRHQYNLTGSVAQIVGSPMATRSI